MTTTDFDASKLEPGTLELEHGSDSEAKMITLRRTRHAARGHPRRGWLDPVARRRVPGNRRHSGRFPHARRRRNFLCRLPYQTGLEPQRHSPRKSRRLGNRRLSHPQ